MKVVIATVLSLGLFACSSERKEVKVVKSFGSLGVVKI